jgi:NADH dehydrogenase
MNEKVVIIGGGFGGLYAAKRLKHAPVEITLIDRRNHHLFQPLLYQVATGGLSPADIASPLRALLRDQPNARVLQGEVTGFDVAYRRVILSDGYVSYDKLIVAAGAGAQYFGKDEWEDYAPSLKSLEDATEIRRRILTAFEAAERSNDPELIRAWMTFVIVGGGPTGVELAGALAEVARETLKNEFRNINPSDARIILVQSPKRILPTYSETLSEKATEKLQRRGVEIITGARVTNVGHDHVTLSIDGETMDILSRTKLWAAGVSASPLGKALAEATGATIDRSGRIDVEPDMSVAGYPDVFVIGDMANFTHQTGEALPAVAQVAIQQGRYVGELIMRGLSGKTMGAFHYRDRGNMATIGRGAAVAEVGRFKFSGWFAWQIWLAIHLMYQWDVRNRALVFIQWVWNFFTRDRSAMLITNWRQPTVTKRVVVDPMRETATMPQVQGVGE